MDIPGRTTIIEHRVHLVDDHPIRRKPYALPCAEREEIQEMINIEIVRTSDLPYASPMVIMKKNGRFNRICVDCLKLNRITVTDS